ncbi:ergosterol biosynthetic protein 28 homolog [Dermacentor andersoni]|uniref:ergosterol biosynthetic protein 28 homolog n=1 Tax=Dermacentor andersoni TaxID=34620 RepID=UPI003B3AC6E6
MTHWLVHPLRGWLALLSVANFATAFRCLRDDNFLQQRVFITLNCSNGLPGCPELERTFAFWSIFNGLVFMHCSFFLEKPPILSMTVCALALYLGYFGNELFVHRSVALRGATWFPIFLSALTMAWLLVAAKFILASRRKDNVEENEQLSERQALFNLRRQRKTRQS